MFVSDSGQVKCRIFMCARHVVHYMSTTMVETKGELTMLLEIDNKREVNLANNWSLSGQIRHIDVKQYFLLELNDEGLLQIKYVPGDNDTDHFTKNVPGPTFKKHIQHKFTVELMSTINKVKC